MKNTNKYKKRRLFITMAAMVLILVAVVIYVEGRLKDETELPPTAEEPVNEEPVEEVPDIENPVDEVPGGENKDNENENPAEKPQEPSTPDDVNMVEDPAAIDALVNKKNNLSSTYVPEDLVKLEGIPTVLENPEINQLRETAYIALKDMFQAAADEEGYELHARSGYRSYGTQKDLYNSYVKNHGQAAADKYSAKPGQSEHQTGLSMDITCAAMNFQLDDTFGNTDEGKWVSENAHRFGFIVRYPKNKEDITGYFYEPWHIRYLGVELATKVYESGLTLEEFMESNL
ncbi:M15 family metallopeptidase [Sedimentibacter saalensis]|uniref:M15 family metallopeptidase n=1 Tax=Sedimentibacter saalensis TaxID=130788 RepID=UPI00289F199C|nr:M15 family metallopeptidase [Sedimentibacter saalensis]